MLIFRFQPLVFRGGSVSIASIADLCDPELQVLFFPEKFIRISQRSLVVVVVGYYCLGKYPKGRPFHPKDPYQPRFLSITSRNELVELID